MHCLECGFDSSVESGKCEICGRPLPTDPDRYFKAGMEAMAVGDMELSAGLLRDSVSLHPHHVSARYNLGTSLALCGQYDDAMQQYLAVLEEDPTYPGIYTALGQVVFASYMHHVEQAEAERKAMFQLFVKAVDEDSDDVDALFSIANAYIATESAEKALPYLKRALRLQPDSSAIYFTLGKALKMLGKFREARVMVLRASELAGPDDPFSEDIEGLLVEIEQMVFPI